MYQEHYIIDRKGVKRAVQIPVDVFERLVFDSEELEDIKNYRKAKKQKSDPLPFKKAFEEIDKK